jgi:F-type H+-transporting ATPase subunit delta
MKESIIAHRYARALFDFAVETDILEKIKSDMDSLVDVCKSNRDFVLLLKSPIVKFHKKIAIINQIFGKQFHQASLNYLQIIIRKRRELFLREIAEHFVDLYKDFKKIKKVRLITPVTIDDQMRKKILLVLSKYTLSQIELNEEVDVGLIGGFVLEVDGKQYDASIMTGIKKLQREFESNIYIKGF